MEYVGPSTSAVDLPRPRVELELGKRRHRRFTGPSALLLFVCLFLPAVEGCNETVYPITMPMFWHPYLYGLVFALAATSVSVRSMRHTVVALRVIAWLTIGGAAFLIVAVGTIGLAELVIGAVCLAAIGRSGFSERRVAFTAIAAGAFSLLWFGLWVASPEARVGVHLSAAGSGGLLVGGLIWLVEAKARL